MEENKEFLKANANEGKIKSETKFPFVLAEYEVPREEDDPRYVQSFAIEQEKEILSFFSIYGFVVVRDVVTKEDCQKTIDEVFQTLEKNTHNKFKRTDISTWGNWPEDGIEKHGQIQRAPVFSKSALRNRQNPNIYKVFSLILGEKNLIVNHDRIGFQRPTVDVPLNNSIRKMNEWKTFTNLHLDMDPWGFVSKDSSKVIKSMNSLYYGDKLNHFIFENNQIHQSLYNGIHLQGVLNLADNFEEDGGFQIVPGFYHYYDEWLRMNEDNKELIKECAEKNSLNFNQKDILQQYSIRIPMKAGSLVVWDQRSPHGTRANNSSRFRCAQFMKFFPFEPMDEGRSYSRAKTISDCIRKSGFDELTELGRQVFGLKVLSDKKFLTK